MSADVTTPRALVRLSAAVRWATTKHSAAQRSLVRCRLMLAMRILADAAQDIVEQAAQHFSERDACDIGHPLNGLVLRVGNV